MKDFFKKYANAPIVKTIEHMLTIAVFWGISAGIAELTTLLASNQTIAHFEIQYPWALPFIAVINMALAGALKYINLKKAEVLVTSE